LVFDLTNKTTLDNLSNWIEELNSYTGGNLAPVWLLVGNKMDLWRETDESHVHQSVAVEFAKKHQCIFIMCSAKTSLGIQKAFEILVAKVRPLKR
jgi:GTPase SAR1 family protein